MRLGIAFDGMERTGEMVAFAAQAEAAGFASVWMAEHLGFRDAITTCTAFLLGTRSLSVVPTAISPYARHPMLIAMSAASMDELAPGRVRVMLGTGSPTAFGEAGIRLDHPRATLREAMLVVRALLAGDFVRFEGTVFRLGAPRMEVRPARPIPLLLAAMGPQMLRLGGELADGVSLSAGSSTAYFRWATAEVRAGAVMAGRQPEAIAMSGFVHVSAGPDRRRAVEQAKVKLAYNLRIPVQKWNLEVSGTAIDREGILAALERRDWARAAALVSDDVVARHAIAGDYDECLARIAEYRASGLDELVCLAVGGKDAWPNLLEVKRQFDRGA
jgi:alkanesulfonate monooxygenase SsuD/methylene tetrahydromethanopterin reductase-like flavin-dependent oxidoreductase (luciferase family)